MNTTADSTAMTRVAWSPVLTEPWSDASTAAARFAASSHVLPTILRAPMVAHALSSRIPAPPRLRALVSALHGRLAVVNPPRPVRLPAALLSTIRGLTRFAGNPSALGFEDAPNDADVSRTESTPHARSARDRRAAAALLHALPAAVRDEVAASASWIAVALYEAATPTIWMDPSYAPDAGPVASAGVAIARLDYRVVIVFGRGPAPTWDAIDTVARAAPHVAWPLQRPPSRQEPATTAADTFTPWFVVALLVPDSWFAAHADPDTLAQWARLTGRADVPDRYWFPDAWERFLEPGRRVGWLTAYDVWRPRRGRLASARDQEPAPDAMVFRPPLTLTPELERGVGVPPGYALVQAAARLSVAVAIMP